MSVYIMTDTPQDPIREVPGTEIIPHEASKVRSSARTIFKPAMISPALALFSTIFFGCARHRFGLP